MDMKISSEANSEAALALQDIVSKNIRILMAAYMTQQEDLASSLGIAQSGLSRKLNRRTDWTVSDIANAAAFYSISVSQLVTPLSITSSAPVAYRGQHDVAPDTMGLAGSVQPRFLKKPDQDDDGSPKTSGVSGAPRFLALPSADDAALLRRRRGYLVALPIAVFVHTGVKTRQLPRFRALA